MEGGIVFQQSELMVVLGVLVGLTATLLVVIVVVATIYLLKIRREKVEGLVYQAPESVFFSPDGGLVGPESGDQAYQAPAGEAEGPISKAEREYDEAMRIVDRQVERATRQVLMGRGGQAGSASPLKFEDVVSEFAGPHQAAAPGVKDE